MVAYIRQHLGVDEEEATRIRQDYWQRYGATLLGLMRHHASIPGIFSGIRTSFLTSSGCWSSSAP
jgi:putative hydrolase of the HAD superfamily